MSTKIYTAYVLRDRRQLWPVCRKIRERCETHVRKELTRIFRALMADAVDHLGKPDDPFKKHRHTDGYFGSLDASRYVQALYGAQLTRMDRDFFDLTVSVAIRQAADGRILLIPYPGSGYLSGSLEFMRRMPELRDYHYQNNSDRPRSISTREWAKRRRTWEPLLSRWRQMLVLDIVSYNGWYDVSPGFDMARADTRKRGRK